MLALGRCEELGTDVGARAVRADGLVEGAIRPSFSEDGG